MRRPKSWVASAPAAGIAAFCTVVTAVSVLFFILKNIQDTFAANPEKSVMASCFVLACALTVACATSAILQRRVDPSRLALVFLAAFGTCLSAVYLIWVYPLVTYPGDFLIWSESDFVNDILKFHKGYSLYSADVNNDSFPYVPGSQLLTYWIAWATGHAFSIPAYRVIQLFYTALAALFAALSCGRLVELTGVRVSALWKALWFSFLFLAATNSITNPYVYNLHNDALAQLVNALALYVLLSYAVTPRKSLLTMMVLIPSAGFLVKQSAVIWLVFYLIWLSFFDLNRSFRRAMTYALCAGGLLMLVIGTCYAMWREPFLYWVFLVLKKHSVSPMRSADHALRAWFYYAMCLGGGLLLLRGWKLRPLAGAWLITLFLLATETYTSGVAWMLNHMGPGCLLAAVWLFAALPHIWSYIDTSQSPRWITAPAAAALCCLLLVGLGGIRIPLPALSTDALRYFRDIDNQFQGQDASRALLDAGSWVYIPSGTIMKDRAPSIGERGHSETGDFSGILQRLHNQYYDKILLRNYHSSDFWYDHGRWRKATGIRAALANNYHETGTIRAVVTPLWAPEMAGNYLFSEIAVLRSNRSDTSVSARSNPTQEAF